MRVIMLGLGHRTAGVALREKLSLEGEALAALCHKFAERYPQAELAVLSTCNRTELYVARPAHEPPGREGLVALMAEHGGIEAGAIEEAGVFRENRHAIGHLFRVATGLDSMVLGEPQIMGQVRRAYERAVALETIGSTLHRVFQAAMAGAKRARRATGMDRARTSVGTAAADFARQIFERFDDKAVLAIGAGEMAKATLEKLVDLAPGHTWLTNRTHERAERLAEALHLAPGEVVRPWASLPTLLTEADIVVSSTGASEPILDAERFAPISEARRCRPLFLLDIALPRDIDPGVARFNNVYLYNLDDLQRAVAQTQPDRREQIEACEAILDEAVGACLGDVRHADVGRLIRRLRRRLHEIGDREEARTLAKMKSRGIEGAEPLLEEHTQRLINKILHLPLSRLDLHDDRSPTSFYAAALRRLFDLEEEQSDPPPPAAHREIHHEA